MLLRKKRPDEMRKSAPRYLVSFSSIMTLLLAFFIILQAFATVQEPGALYAGQGSFIQALETGGLGSFWPGGGAGDETSHYLAPEGQGPESPRQRRVDPELEDGQQAAQKLQQDEGVEMSDADRTFSRRVLSTPLTFRADKTALTDAERRFLREMAPNMAPLLRTRGCLIGIGASFACTDAQEPEVTRLALRAASEVRRHLIEQMVPQGGVPAERLYAFARRALPGPEEAPRPAGEVKICLLLNRTAASGADGAGARPDAPQPGPAENPKGDER